MGKLVLSTSSTGCPAVGTPLVELGFKLWGGMLCSPYRDYG